jgi:phage shock protein E
MDIKAMLLGGIAAALLAVTAVGTEPAAEPAPVEIAPLMSQAELLAKIDSKDAELVVLDVRTPAEFAAGHVPGARNVSHDQLAAQLTDLAVLRDKQVVLYCRSGRRTLVAEAILRGAGFTQLRRLEGDFLAWEAAQRPIER